MGLRLRGPDNRTAWIVIAVLAVLGTGDETVTLALAHARAHTDRTPYAGEPMTGDRRPPTFMLADDRGRMFVYAPRAGDPPTAIYFGYTRCPDACPLALAGLVHAHRAVPALRVLFVTVDPSFDTPAVVHRYLARFDASFVGLTGTPPQVKGLAAAFGVTADGGARPDHDDTIVFVDRHGTALLRYRGATFDPLAFADDVRRSDTAFEERRKPRVETPQM